MRIKGWMGRADQTTKVKGMFVRPEQIAEIGKRHPELGRLRLVVTREGETDVMTLKAECRVAERGARGELAATLRAVTKLGGNVELVAPAIAAQRRQGDRGRALDRPADLATRLPL